MDDRREESWISSRCRNLEASSSWLGLAAAVWSFLVVSLIDSFGVYYDALVEKYDSTRAAVGWIYSFRWMFIFASGIFISPLVEIFGCRRVTMCFGFLYSAAIALSAVAPTVGSLYFIFGVLTGAGNSGVYLGTITALQQLFTTNRGFATGFAAIGVPLGILIHPLHTKYFLDTYGLSGVYLMHGAISFHIMIAAFAFKNPKRPASKEVKEQDHKAVHTISQFVEKATKNSDKQAEATSSSSTSEKYHVFKTYFKGMIDFTLFKNICFVLTVVHFILLWTVRLGIASQIVSCAKFRGISDQRATYLLSVSGFIGLFMTVVSGVIMNMSWLNPALFSGFAAISLTISSFGCAFSRSYMVFLISAVFTGIADGISSNLPLYVLYVVGLDKFPRGMALLWTSLVPSAVGSSPFVGWMVDIQGDYVTAFVVLGACGIISASLAILVFIIITKRSRHLGSLSEVTITTTL